MIVILKVMPSTDDTLLNNIRFTLVSGVKLFCAFSEKFKVSSIIIICVLYQVTILFYAFTSVFIFRYFVTCMRLLIFTYGNFSFVYYIRA